MKKQTKLFAILLAFVLILGTLSVGALAASNFGYDYAQGAEDAVEGESIRTHLNFDSFDTQSYGAANAITANPSFKTDNNTNASLVYKGKCGNPSIVEASGGAFNKYLSIDMNTSNGESVGGYMSIYLSDRVNSTADLEGRTLSDIKYHVLDFDFYSPNGYATATEYFGALFQLRVLSPDGKITDITNIGYKQGQAGVNIKGSGLYNNYPRGWTSSVAINKNSWTHITYILESYVDNAGTPDDTTDDFIGLTSYNVIDGKIVSTYVFENGNNSGGTYVQVLPDGTKKENCYNSDMTQVFINEIRFPFGNPTNNVVTNLDNIGIRTYTNDYDDTELAAILAQGVGADLTAWDRNAYDVATVPFSTAVAKIGDVEYTNLAAAVKAAEAGATIDMVTNSSLAVVVDKPLTINLNGKTVSGVTAAEGYFPSVLNTSTAITIKPVSEAVFKITKTDDTTYLSDDNLYNVFLGLNSAARKKIELLKDHTYQADKGNYLQRSVIFDLGGHTLNVVENMKATAPFTVQKEAQVTFTNGTINVTNIFSENAGKTFPLFGLGSTTSTLTVDGVIVNSGPLFYNASIDNPKLVIKNSEFNITTAGAHTIGGLIESRNNVTVTATNCKIYLQKSGLLSSLSYKNAGTDVSAIKSTFTFTDCDIYADGPTNLFHSINNYTTVRFDGCNISGNITPTRHSYDNPVPQIGSMTSKNVILGKGTTVSQGSVLTASVDSGLVATKNSEGYTFVSGSLSKPYTLQYSIVDDSGDPDFKIERNGVAFNFNGTLGEAFATFDSAIDYRVILLKDMTYEYTSVISLHYTRMNKVTLDLGGKTLNVVENVRSTALFGIQSQNAFTICNGNLNVSNIYAENAGKTYPLISLEWGNSKFVMDGVTYKGGPLIFNGNSKGCSVTITNSDFNVNTVGGHTRNTFVESRAAMTFSATDSNFYLQTGGLIASICYNGGTDVSKLTSTYTFTNCDIFRTKNGSSLQELVPIANGYATITFNACNLHGTLNPKMDANDTSYAQGNMLGIPPREDTIVLGEGTTLASGASFTCTKIDGDFVFVVDTSSYAFKCGDISEEYTLIYRIAEMPEDADFIITTSALTAYYKGDIKGAVSAAPGYATIRLMHDVTIEQTGYWYISKPLTFDLNTYTINLLQQQTNTCGIALNYAGTFKFMNGTLMNSYLSTENSTFPMLFMNAKATVIMDNIVSYTSGLVYNYGQTGVTVEFIGGEHHLVRGTTNTSGGFVDSRGNITVTANGTKFYAIDSSTPFHIGSYKTAAGSRSNSLAFTNCYFYMPTVTKQLIRMNDFTTVSMVGCTVHASLNPTRTDLDRDQAGSTISNPVAGSITIGEGTVIAKGATTSDAVKFADGCVKFYSRDNATVHYNIYTTGNIAGGDVTFAIGYVIDNPSAARFTATIGGVEYYVDSGIDLLDLMQNIVDDGGEIRFLQDAQLIIDTTFGDNNEKHFYEIRKGLTVDLDGHTFDIIEAFNNQCALQIYSAFKMKNGTLNVTNTQTTTGTFPVFWLSSKNAALTLEDMTVYSGQLIYSYSASGASAEIIRGEYHVIASYLGTFGGLIESRANFTFTATDAKFYLKSTSLLTSSSHKESSATKASSFTFNGCEIYSPDVNSDLFTTINGYTTVTFNDCKIRGDLALNKRSDDAASPVATASNVIFSGNTSVSSPTLANYTAPEGYGFFLDNTTHVFQTEGFTSAAYALGATLRSVEDALFNVTTGTKALYLDDSYTLTSALSIADKASDFYLLGDLFIITDPNASTHYAVIDKQINIDLGGNTVYFSQSKNSGYCNIGIKTDAKVVIENGTFVYAINQTYIDTHASPQNVNSTLTNALFRIVQNNANVTFNNVNAYGGAFIYSYNSTGTTVNFNGGEYHIGRSVDLYGGGIVEMRANATVNVNGTTICLYNGAPLMTLASRYQTGERKSTATFTNCTILGTGASHNILPTLNNCTTVRFDNCSIFGSINPEKHGSDINNGNDDYPVSGPVSGSIILGNGTYIAAGATMKEGVVVAEDGRAIVEVDKSYAFLLQISSGTIFDTENPTFTIAGAKKVYAFGFVVGEPPLKSFNVIWYKEDGHTVILIQSVVEGTVGVFAPAYVPGDNNGWYKTGFEGWTTVNGSSSKVDLATFVVTGDSSFYPAIKADATPTPYLSGAEYNLTLTGNITINFYLPSTPEGVNVIGVYDEGGNLISYKGVITPDGVYHRMYVINTVGATELTTANKLRVVFTVEYNGELVELTQNITISPIKYAKAILADSEKQNPTQTAATHTLIADMIRYSNTLAKTVKGATDTELDALLDKYSDLCSALPSANDFAEYTTSVANLKGYISTISFEVSEYQPRWVFTFKDTMKVVDVKITLDGYYELPDENGYNFGSLTYELDTEESKYSAGYVTTAYMESIPMYNIDRVITISVTTEDGKTVSGTYSLNTYYANVNAEGETLEGVREFLKAFRAFGITSAGYRYADGIKQAGAAKEDFFTCDHKATGSWTSASGRYCSDCKTYVFAYADYVANLSSTYGGKLYSSRDEALAGKVNSYTVIDYCHYMANSKYTAGNKVGVYAGNHTYYIGEAIDCNGKTDEITVMTDTCWSGAYFVVDDSPFFETDATFKKSIFGIRAGNVAAPNGTKYTNSGVDITEKIATALDTQAGERILTTSTTNIGWSSGMPMLILIKDHSQSRYHREGVNASKAASQEVILIDEFGNVNPTTPIEWDYIYNPNFNSTSVSGGTTVYENCFSATAYPITMAPIKLSGLDKNGNINCYFETIANNNTIATSYNSCGRNIWVRASNVTVEGLDHTMTEDDDENTPRQAYNGFINVTFAHNTVIKDMSVDQHVPSSYTDPDTGKKVGMGSYEFAGADSVYTSWINCTSKTFFDADGSTTYRGLFGTNRMRNNYLKNCVLNSYDAHSGAYNTTIEDSTFEHFNFVGQGDIIIKNVTIYADGGYSGIILRSDYGSRWEGNVYIDGFDLRHSDSYTRHYVDLIRAEYINWDFGYTDQTDKSGNYLPFVVYAKDVTVHQYTRTKQEYTLASPGQIQETLTKSDRALGVYNYYDTSLKNKSYSASTDNNKQTPTQAIYFEGGDVNSLADLCTPNNAYFKNMKIYINGVEQNWYACAGSHTDENNDMHCDSCLARINCTTSHSGNDNGKCSSCTATIKDTSGCVTGDTLVTLADGTTARIDSLKDGDMILAWNFYTGKIEAVPAAKIVNHGYEQNTVVALTFEDGSIVKVVNMHQFFSTEANDFVTINQANVESYVGKAFASIDKDGNVTEKKLVSYEIYKEYNEAYAIVSAYHYNAIVGGMLTMDFKARDVALFRYFEIADGMKFDEEKMAEDIAEYGLFTYEEFSDYVSYEEFVVFGIQYMKVSVGKGYSSVEHMIELIERYGLGK